MPKLFRKKIILLRTAGAGNFVASDAVLATGIEITPLAGDTVNRELERPYFGASEDIAVNTHQTISFSVEYAPAAGVANATQPWEQLLEACGFAGTQEAAANGHPPRTVFNPITGGESAVKIGYNIDGILHTLDNCPGTVSLELSANAIPRWQFTMTGSYADPTNTAALTGDFSAWQEPQIADQTNTPMVSIFNQDDLSLSSFSFDCGGEVNHRSLINADPDVRITGRSPSASLTIDAKSIATISPIALAKAGTSGAINITHGRAGGRQLTIAMANCKIGQGVSYSDDNGILQQQLPIQVLPTNGNDEITITVT